MFIFIIFFRYLQTAEISKYVHECFLKKSEKERKFFAEVDLLKL